jgi:hypothetical protein
MYDHLSPLNLTDNLKLESKKGNIDFDFSDKIISLNDSSNTSLVLSPSSYLPSSIARNILKKPVVFPLYSFYVSIFSSLTASIKLFGSSSTLIVELFSVN